MLSKKALTPADKRELVDYARDSHKMSIRQALRLFQIHPSVYYYKPLPDSDGDIRENYLNCRNCIIAGDFG